MHRNELEIPAVALRDKSATEIIRIWDVGGEQHVGMNVVWKNPGAWGIFLTDLATNIAEEYARSEGLDVAAVLARIEAGLIAEVENPTDTGSGGPANRT